MQVGLVIGKSGDTIKQLQERSGAKVAVIQDSTVITDFDKPLRISGEWLWWCGCNEVGDGARLG